MSSKCPHCGKAAYPVKDDAGNIIWKNMFKFDWLTLILIISIILILIGANQINKQCYNVLEEPCKFIDQYDCTGKYYTTGDIEILTGGGFQYAGDNGINSSKTLS